MHETVMNRPHTVVFTGHAAIRAHRRAASANWVAQQMAAVYGHQLEGDPTMGKHVTQQLIESRMLEGRLQPGDEIDRWRTLA